jgi:hypothetical protein
VTQSYGKVSPPKKRQKPLNTTEKPPIGRGTSIVISFIAVVSYDSVLHRYTLIILLNGDTNRINLFLKKSMQIFLSRTRINSNKTQYNTFFSIHFLSCCHYYVIKIYGDIR